MILRENVKCLSNSGQGEFSWGFRCKKRGAFCGFIGSKIKKYI